MTAEANGGTWSMTFDDVTVEPGKKYVVFEYAYDSQGNLVASHADANDSAQTVVVTEKSSAPKGGSSSASGTTQGGKASGGSSGVRGALAKTGDGATGATAALLAVAFGTAALALRARRKNEQ